MLISATDAREYVQNIEDRFEQGRLKQVRKFSRINWGDEDWTSPEGYDYSPDMGVHRYDGGGTFF